MIDHCLFGPEPTRAVCLCAKRVRLHHRNHFRCHSARRVSRLLEYIRILLVDVQFAVIDHLILARHR